MKAEKLSVNRVCIAIGAFLLLLSVSMSLFLYFLTKNTLVLCCGLLYAAGAFGCLTLFLAFIRRKLTLFSDALCKQLDDMMSSDREPPQYAVEENLFYKIQHRLSRLYEVLREGKSRVLKYLGHLTPEEMSRVDDAVKISLALNPMGNIQKLKPIIRSTAAYAPPEVVDGKPPVYPYTPIKSDFEDAGTVEEMMLYTELQSAVHAMIQRLEYSFTFNPSLLTSPKRKKQVAEILTEAEKYIWRIKEEMRCA